MKMTQTEMNVAMTLLLRHIDENNGSKANRKAYHAYTTRDYFEFDEAGWEIFLDKRVITKDGKPMYKIRRKWSAGMRRELKPVLEYIGE